MEFKKTVNGDGGAPCKVAEGYLLGCGNPLLDISAVVPKDFFEKYKVNPGTQILAEEHHKPIYNDMVNEFKVEYVAGGATQNTIRIAQWMMQSEGASTYIGSIGKDQFGSQLRKSCERDGVRTCYYESEESTGTCAVLVNEEGERSLIANLSAANAYKHAHTQSAVVQEIINKARVYYVAGFFLSVPEGPQTMMSIAKHAAENNKVFCMNLSAQFLIQFFSEQMNAVLPYTDFVFANEIEGAEFAKKQGWDCSLEETALRLSMTWKHSGARCRTVVFTQGAEPTIVASNGEITLYPVPKLAKELLVDTNGAGDAFVGGFLARLCAGLPISECVRAGHYAARVVIQRSGCTFPTQPDI